MLLDPALNTDLLQCGCVNNEAPIRSAKHITACSCSDAERQWTGPFCFIQAADPQLGLMKAWRDGDCDNGGEEWAEEVELTKQAVEAVNQLRPRPRFMVLCGDLVHAMPGMNRAQKEHILSLKQTLYLYKSCHLLLKKDCPVKLFCECVVAHISHIVFS